MRIASCAMLLFLAVSCGCIGEPLKETEYERYHLAILCVGRSIESYASTNQGEIPSLDMLLAQDKELVGKLARLGFDENQARETFCITPLLNSIHKAGKPGNTWVVTVIKAPEFNDWSHVLLGGREVDISDSK